MWVAKFKLRSDEDIYSPLFEKYHVEAHALPLTHYKKGERIHLLAAFLLSGTPEDKKRFIHALKKDKRVAGVEQDKDFLIVHAIEPLSREVKAEIQIFYNPQYIMVRPVLLTMDGWEEWEVGCLDRDELNKMVIAAKRYYHGKLLSMKREVVRNVGMLQLSPHLTDHQLSAVQQAYKEGYYAYPRKLTIPDLAKRQGKAYATFQEHLRKAENRIIDFFLKYR